MSRPVSAPHTGHRATPMWLSHRASTRQRSARDAARRRVHRCWSGAFAGAARPRSWPRLVPPALRAEPTRSRPSGRHARRRHHVIVVDLNRRVGLRHRLSTSRTRLVVDLPEVALAGAGRAARRSAQRAGHAATGIAPLRARRRADRVSTCAAAVRDPPVYRAAARTKATPPSARDRPGRRPRTRRPPPRQPTPPTATADRTPVDGQPPARMRTMPAAAAEQRPEPPPKRMIVIDPGHGGIDPGHHRLGRHLREGCRAGDRPRSSAASSSASGRYRVVLTRDADDFVRVARPHRDRARSGRPAVHLAPCRQPAATPRCRGASVYTLSERASDAEAAQASPRRRTRPTSSAGVDLSQPGRRWSARS